MAKTLTCTVSNPFSSGESIPNKIITDNQSSLTDSSLTEFRIRLNEIGELEDPLDDTSLLRYLRTKSFDIPAAVKLFKRFKDWKIRNVDYLSIPFEEYQIFYQRNVITPFRKRSPSGSKVICVQPGKWELEDPEMSAARFISALFLLAEKCCQSPKTQENGIVLIFDFCGMSVLRAAHLISFFSFKKIYTVISFIQGFAVKMKGIYGINSPKPISAVYATVKFLITPKVRDRIFIMAEGPSALLQFFHVDNLPAFLNGNVPDEEAEDSDLIRSK